MKLITFALWGTDPKYLVGAIKNAELAKQIYPDWLCRFYVAQSVSVGYKFKLKNYNNVQLIEKAGWGDWTSMFWRFEPAAEDDVEIMISRDTDSRLNYREKAAVDKWVASDKGFHIMRDHPWHKYPVLGGMWGVKRGVLPDIKKLIGEFAQEDKYGTDYEFFSEIIKPRIVNNVMTHDEFFNGEPFPTKREGLEFVGEVYDEYENTVPEHTAVLKEALRETG